MQVEERFARAHGVRGDRDSADYVRCVTGQQRAGERACRVRVIAVRDEIRQATLRVAPDRAELLGEREARSAAAAEPAPLHGLGELLEFERARPLERRGRGSVEQPWRGASRQRSEERRPPKISRRTSA